MKADILEQLVEDWLQAKGYFIRAGLKFKPSTSHEDYIQNKDQIPSDVDVVGFHPLKKGAERIFAVSCKSWQDGFAIRGMLDDLTRNPERKLGNKETWKHFRELVRPKWTEAFIAAIREATGSEKFTYITAVTIACDPENRRHWENWNLFTAALKGNPIRFLTLEEMLKEVHDQLGTTVAQSQFSRTLQLMKSAGLKIAFKSRNTKK